MPVELSTDAQEQGTYIVTASFQDEDGNNVVPNTLMWTLTDHKGNVINSRDAVSITPAQSVEIVLQGDDLKILSDEVDLDYARRKVTVEGTYDSNAGTDLPLKAEAEFKVYNLQAVT